MTEIFVPSPTVNELTQKAGQVLPSSMTQTVKEQLASARSAVPQVEKDVKTYVQNFQFKLEHLIFIGYFLAVFWRSRLGVFLSFDLNLWLTQFINLLTWFLGGFLGWNLLFLDNVVYLYLLYPEDPLAKEAKQLMKEKGLWSWLKFMIDEQVEEKLTLRSFLFQVGLIFLIAFTLTSTSSILGKGVVIGLTLHLLLEQWFLHRSNPEGLNQRLFWQIKRKVSLEEQRYFLIILTVVFLIFSLLV